ncbi:hypothetical protein OTK49_00995 [Vibrio coralliirubri]|uniref:hypothetical protein n=1 Tax=Vibrio coralliirubri TaxID=1516159 RepID=UPI0022838213|nr:hypothetical protein [Vibrio coralliirubri]MCY9861107.1 hypothetical protein [Vibrio coralliirubri]
MNNIEDVIGWILHLSATGLVIYILLMVYMGVSFLTTYTLESIRIKWGRKIKTQHWKVFIVLYTLMLIAANAASCFTYMSFVRYFNSDMWTHVEVLVGSAAAIISIWMSCFSNMPLCSNLDSYKEEYLLPCFRK